MQDIRYPLLLKFLLPYTLATTLILSIGGWFFYHTSLRSLDDEFSRRLISISEMVSRSINTVYLTRIRPGDEDTYLYKILLQDLKKMQQGAGVKNISLVGPDNRILIQANEEIPTGQEYLLLRLDQDELERVWKGTSTASILYQGSDGQYYKSGYAPIRDGQGRIVAVTGVEAGAEFLAAAGRLKQQVLWIVLVSALIQFLISLILSRSVTRPLKSLVTAIDRLGRHEAYTKVLIKTRDEIGYLGSRFNDMLDSLREKNRLLQERMEALRELSAGIAHEIRNPLAAIEGFVELLSRKVPSQGNSQAQKLMDEIIQEVKNLNQIVTDFLAFAREPGLQFEPVDMSTVMDSALHIALPTGIANSIRVEKEAVSPLPLIQGDPMELRKAILNVVLNAVQAMPKGGTLKTRLHVESPWLIVMVQDSGVGIAREVQDRIFNPFFTTKDNGTGLGLAITQRIIESHGGNITFESQPGQGSRFMIRLPIKTLTGSDQDRIGRGVLTKGGNHP